MYDEFNNVLNTIINNKHYLLSNTKLLFVSLHKINKVNYNNESYQQKRNQKVSIYGAP